MPSTDRELRTNQKNLLFELLEIKQEADSKGVVLKRLEKTLSKAEGNMDAEDIAWVKEKFAESE